MTIPPPTTARLSFTLWLRLCALAPSHFVGPGNNLASPPPPSPIASMVAQPPSCAHECQQLLTNVQKTVVIEWCRWHGDMADPMTCAKLHAMIYDLTQWTASENWMRRFLKRNVGQITMKRAHGLVQS